MIGVTNRRHRSSHREWHPPPNKNQQSLQLCRLETIQLYYGGSVELRVLPWSKSSLWNKLFFSAQKTRVPARLEGGLRNGNDIAVADVESSRNIALNRFPKIENAHALFPILHPKDPHFLEGTKGTYPTGLGDRLQNGCRSIEGKFARLGYRA